MLRKAIAAQMLCAALIAPAKAEFAGITSCAGGTLAVTNSSANVALSGCGPTVMIYNITSQEAFYATGPTSQAAATAQTSSTAAPIANSYSIPGNQFVVIQISQSSPGFLAAITPSNTTTLRIVQGYAAP